MAEQLTAFKELRTAQLSITTSWLFNGTTIEDNVVPITTGSGTIAIVYDQAVLSSGSAINSIATIRTAGIVPPAPGIGLLSRISGLFSSGVVGSTQYLGIDDANNALFFGYNGATFGIMIRSHGIDNFVPQNQWNFDQLLGPGNAFILNPLKGNIYSVQYQCLGYGHVDFAVEDPFSGYPVLVHRYSSLNSELTPAFNTRYSFLVAEVRNYTNATDILIKTPAAALFAEGSPALPITGTAAASAGNLYSVTTGTLAVVSNGYLVLQLTNPVNNRKNAFIQRISSGGIHNTIVDVFRNATFEAVGTALTPLNQHFSFPDQSGFTVKYLTQKDNPTEGGEILLSTIALSGNTSIDYVGTIIVPPGWSFYIRLLNPNSSGSSNNITVVWSEILT